MMFGTIPEEVIWELSLDEVIDEPYEPPYASARRTMSSFSRTVCMNCGEPNVKVVSTPNGERLMYTNGALRGKLHACPE